MKILFDHKILVNQKKIVITLWTVQALCTTIFKVYFHVACVTLENVVGCDVFSYLLS